MLVKATIADVDKNADFIYTLALDKSKSSYPTYADGIKTKNEFIGNSRSAAIEDNRELLLYYDCAGLQGWISYFWIPEDMYIQLDACNIAAGTRQALSEFLEYLREAYIGYTLYFGFPRDNIEAIAFLEENGFACIEKDWHNCFSFSDYEPLPEEGDIARITRENFDDFRAVYHPDADAYWNCDRLYENIDDWIIFATYEGGKPIGAIYLSGRSGMYEIFGVEYSDGVCRADVLKRLLIAALNHCKLIDAKYMIFMCDDEALPTVSEPGFNRIGEYLLYIKQI